MRICFALATKGGRALRIVSNKGTAVGTLRTAHKVVLETTTNRDNTHLPSAASTPVAVGSRGARAAAALVILRSPASTAGTRTTTGRCLPSRPTRNICSITILSPTLCRTQFRTPTWPKSSTGLRGSSWFIIDVPLLVYVFKIIKIYKILIRNFSRYLTHHELSLNMYKFRLDLHGWLTE